MTDDDLDFLLAQARAETPADAGAADRFLARHWAALGPPARRRHAPLWPPLLAAAAVLAGVLVLRPPSALPASAAYDVYQETLGEGW